MKKLSILLIMLSILSISLIAAKSGTIGKVKLIKGKAVYRTAKAKKFKRLKVNQRLNAGTLIKTSRKTKVSIVLKGGSLIEVKGNSRLLLNKEILGKSSASLIKGKARFKIQKMLKGSGAYNVYTPTAVVGVRGTEYEVAIAGDGSSAIVVDEGEVAVNNGRSETAIGKNQSAEASLDSNDIKKSDKKMDTGKWEKNKNKEIKKDPAGKMDAINTGLNEAAKEQEQTIKELSAAKPDDKEKAEKNVESGCFNHCKSEGLFEAAKDIKKGNKKNKNVQDKFKSIRAIHSRLDKLHKILEEKFACIDKVYEEKEKMLDKKLEDKEKRLEEKFKKFDFED